MKSGGEWLRNGGTRGVLSGRDASLRAAPSCVWPPCPLVAARRSSWARAGVGRSHAEMKAGMETEQGMEVLGAMVCPGRVTSSHLEKSTRGAAPQPRLC